MARTTATQINLSIPGSAKPPPTPRKPCRVCGKKNCTCIEDLLAGQMRLSRFPEAVRELPFARESGRNWRADFGWPFIRLLVELQGGIWSAGAHIRGVGYEEDCEKNNEAALLGWLLLTFTRAMVEDGRALAVIARAMQQRGVRLGDGNAIYTVKYPTK